MECLLSILDEAAVEKSRGPKMIKTIVIRLTLFVAIFFLSGLPSKYACTCTYSLLRCLRVLVAQLVGPFN